MNYNLLLQLVKPFIKNIKIRKQNGVFIINNDGKDVLKFIPTQIPDGWEKSLLDIVTEFEKNAKK